MGSIAMAPAPAKAQAQVLLLVDNPWTNSKEMLGNQPTFGHTKTLATSYARFSLSDSDDTGTKADKNKADETKADETKADESTNTEESKNEEQPKLPRHRRHNKNKN